MKDEFYLMILNEGKAVNMSMKILIVEDEKPIADILKFNLEKEGYQVLVVNDGNDAIDIAEEENPDLILLDLMLPAKDGYEVLREILKMQGRRVVMITEKHS